MARRSDHTFELKEGILYPMLHGLETDRYVTSCEREAPSGRKRKYYRLTKKGEKVLEEKQAEWVLFTEKVNAVVCAPA